MANSEGESPDFGELGPLDELKPLGDEFEPLGEEAGEASLAGLEGEEFVPPDFESLATPETVSPDAAEPSGLEAMPASEIAAEDVAGGIPAVTIEEPIEVTTAAEPEKVLTLQDHLKANLDWVIAGGIALVLLLLALVGLFNFSTAFYVVAVGVLAYTLWKMRELNDLYTVILGFALIAILTAVYCLWLEVGRYQFDTKAREAKQRASTPRCRGRDPSAKTLPAIG